jgi:hypothetical protein
MSRNGRGRLARSARAQRDPERHATAGRIERVETTGYGVTDPTRRRTARRCGRRSVPATVRSLGRSAASFVTTPRSPRSRAEVMTARGGAALNGPASGATSARLCALPCGAIGSMTAT